MVRIDRLAPKCKVPRHEGEALRLKARWLVRYLAAGALGEAGVAWSLISSKESAM